MTLLVKNVPPSVILPDVEDSVCWCYLIMWNRLTPLPRFVLCCPYSTLHSTCPAFAPLIRDCLGMLLPLAIDGNLTPNRRLLEMQLHCQAHGWILRGGLIQLKVSRTRRRGSPSVKVQTQPNEVETQFHSFEFCAPSFLKFQEHQFKKCFNQLYVESAVKTGFLALWTKNSLRKSTYDLITSLFYLEQLHFGAEVYLESVCITLKFTDW